jgi:superfamily II DNA helicase RecQ
VCILNGMDVVCITATGDGKSDFILFPALARKEMINIVIEPTNSLESDMVRDIGFLPNQQIFTVI